MNFFERLKYLLVGGSVKTKGISFVADGYTSQGRSTLADTNTHSIDLNARKVPQNFSFVADNYNSNKRLHEQRKQLLSNEDVEYSWLSPAMRDYSDRDRFGMHDEDRF